MVYQPNSGGLWGFMVKYPSYCKVGRCLNFGNPLPNPLHNGKRNPLSLAPVTLPRLTPITMWVLIHWAGLGKRATPNFAVTTSMQMINLYMIWGPKRSRMSRASSPNISSGILWQTARMPLTLKRRSTLLKYSYIVIPTHLFLQARIRE